MGGVETLVFSSIANLHAPVKKKRVRNSKAPWLTPEIKRLMWERDIEQSESPPSLMTCNDQFKWPEYRRLKNRVNQSIKASKKDYYHSYFEDNVGKAKATSVEWNKYTTIAKEKLCSGDKNDY